MNKWIKIAAIILAVLLVIFVIAMYEAGRRAGMTEKTAATVTRVDYEPAEVSPDPDESDTPERTRVAYNYSFAGTSVEGSTTLHRDARNKYSKGQSIAVCFNPEFPDDSALADTFEGKCGD